MRLTICFSLPFYKCFEFLFINLKCVVQRVGISKSLMKYKLLNSKQASYQKLRQHQHHCQKRPKISNSNTNHHHQRTYLCSIYSRTFEEFYKWLLKLQHHNIKGGFTIWENSNVWWFISISLNYILKLFLRCLILHRGNFVGGKYGSCIIY